MTQLNAAVTVFGALCLGLLVNSLRGGFIDSEMQRLQWEKEQLQQQLYEQNLEYRGYRDGVKDSR